MNIITRRSVLWHTALAVPVHAADSPPVAERISAGGFDFAPSKPPASLVFRPELGLVTAPALSGQLVHASPRGKHLYETRAVKTPNGDYLLMFPEGEHYASGTGQRNRMVAYRSADRGHAWHGPTMPFAIDYSQHGFIPLIPRGSRRLYAFGTQPIESLREGRENCPIGYRWSDDNGLTWSGVKLIAPENDPQFKGMSVMRMCETGRGTWLLGAHEADWTVKPLRTRQYLLRSTDQGRRWTVLPGPRPQGWQVPRLLRMDEGRPVSLGGSQVLTLFRTPTGRLWSAHSEDDGQTWTDPAPTPLVHPDAPPMIFPLPDGRTLAAFHHNRFSDRNYSGLNTKPEIMKDRSELWVSLSSDGGRTWSEPRFLLVNALGETDANAFFNYQCSYLDAFPDGRTLHLFLPHRWSRALHLTISAEALPRLPLRADLQTPRSARVNIGFPTSFQENS